MINYHQPIFALIFQISHLQSPPIIFKITQYLQDISVCYRYLKRFKKILSYLKRFGSYYILIFYDIIK